jgi:Domain of unknown function (DUF4166)
LNEGILVKFCDKYYYGAEGLHFLALVGSSVNLFNKLNVLIFSSKYLSRIFYPPLKFIRNILLFVRDIPPISTTVQKPLIEMIFVAEAGKVPKILRKRYSITPYTTNNLLLKGIINIHSSRIFDIFAPLFKFMDSLPSYPEQNIPTTVEFISEPTSDAISMNRTFYYHNKPAYHFNSKIIHLKDNVVLELMKFGLAAKLIYRLDGNKIIMDYGGYALRLGRLIIPLPLGFIIGKFSACEEEIDKTKFNMAVYLEHPIFGKIYRYEGTFAMEEVA